MGRIRVLLSDSSRIGCEVLQRGIEAVSAEFEILGGHTHSRALVEAARTRSPDVVLLSINLEDGPLAGLAALHAFRELRLRSVLLLDANDPETVVSAFRGGAKGVFVREQPVALLCKCMRQVHDGQLWADSAQLEYVLEAFAAASPVRVEAGAIRALTAREEQIAQLVVQGFSNRAISRQLHLSEHTVKNYLFRIFDKLGISTRVELAMYIVHRRNVA